MYSYDWFHFLPCASLTRHRTSGSYNLIFSISPIHNSILGLSHLSNSPDINSCIFTCNVSLISLVICLSLRWRVGFFTEVDISVCFFPVSLLHYAWWRAPLVVPETVVSWKIGLPERMSHQQNADVCCGSLSSNHEAKIPLYASAELVCWRLFVFQLAWLHLGLVCALD